MSRLRIPAIHLPHGKEVFRPFPYRPSLFKRILKSYAERSLLQCVPQDIIVLPKRPDPEYLEFLLGLGLGSENIIVCDGDRDNFAADILNDEKTMEELSRYADCLIPSSFYIHLEEEREIARRIGREDAVMHADLTRMFNTIYFLIRLEEEMEISSIKRYQLRSSRFAESVAALLEKEGALFVRGNESIGGSQVFTIKTGGDVEKAHKKVYRNRQITRYFASRLLEPLESWNVQYELDRNGCSLLGASRQILEKCAHTGNVAGYDIPYQIMETAREIIDGLYEMGAAGIIGIDLALHEGKACPVEINARHNSSTPLISVLRKIAGEKKSGKVWFQSFSIHTGDDFSFRDFVKLAGRANLLGRSSKSGFLPYHFDSCRFTGNVDVAAFAGEPEELETMVRGLKDSV
jgi:hypothetical protein